MAGLTLPVIFRAVTLFFLLPYFLENDTTGEAIQILASDPTYNSLNEHISTLDSWQSQKFFLVSSSICRRKADYQGSFRGQQSPRYALFLPSC